MLRDGMPILSSGRKDELSKDGQQRAGEGHASQRGRTGKGLEERGHVFGNKSVDLVHVEHVSIRVGETRLAQRITVSGLDREDKEHNKI